MCYFFPQVDATEEPALGSAYGVQGYPTLKWFVDGEAKEYSGGRQACAILACLTCPAETDTKPQHVCTVYLRALKT